MATEIPFEITGWDESPYDEPADGPPLARITVRKAYTGALAGTSEAELLTCGRAGYLANERVTGTLDGREGTFVLQHGAVGSTEEDARLFGYVVPGSGTGALAGLRGEARFAHERLTLDYELDEG